MKTCPNADCSDMVETGRAGEFVDDLTACPLCGTALVSSAADPSGEHPEEGLVLAGHAVGVAAVAIAKSLLATGEICYTTRLEGLQDLFGAGQIGTGFSIAVGPVEFWVPESQAVEAAAILASLDEELANSEPLDEEFDSDTDGAS